MRILLIDDDVSVLENLTLFLTNEFHSVESRSFVKDRAALLEVLSSFEPDGIVLDYGMECLGTELYVWIREWKSTASIVFYTNYARSLEQAHMLQVGAEENHIIEKREVGRDLDAILDALRRRS